jgi:transcriptional regulator with PAS, ATPase and Fis domain
MATEGEGATLGLEADRALTHLVVGRFHVTVLKGPDAGASFSSKRERTAIGTHESADVVLHDQAVSRFHCELVPEGGRIRIRDLGSKNGTVVDGLTVLDGYLRQTSTIGLGRTELRVELQRGELSLPLSEREGFGLLVGRSVAMRRVFAMLEDAAKSDATVLVEGETGTGKELVAESIHKESERREGPFVIVDCGAVPAELLESELFGHERGSFTGASAARKGAFEAASGGSIFLDEIGELPLELQPKLLRALERREVKRVGADTYQPVDVRVIAATNRSLRQEVNERRFRADLYYRVAVLEVQLPPLRDRLDDLPLLVGVLGQHLRSGAGGDGFDLAAPSFVAELGRHAWPGNVRELRNYLERCVAHRRPLPLEAGGALGAASAEDLDAPFKLARDRALAAFERRYLEHVLQRTGGNAAAAARTAGLDRAHLYRLLWRHGLR